MVDAARKVLFIDITRKPPISLSILRVTFFSFCFCHDSSSTQLMPGKQLMMGMFPRGTSQPTLCLLEAVTRMLLSRPLSKLPFPVSAGIWCWEGGKLSSFSPKSGNRCDSVNTDDHLNCHLTKGRWWGSNHQPTLTFLKQLTWRELHQ